MKPINEWTKEEFLSLPNRNDHETSRYDSIVLLPDEAEPENGVLCVTAIGCHKDNPTEIIVQHWNVDMDNLWSTSTLLIQIERLPASSVLHIHSKYGKFVVFAGPPPSLMMGFDYDFDAIRGITDETDQ